MVKFIKNVTPKFDWSAKISNKLLNDVNDIKVKLIKGEKIKEEQTLKRSSAWIGRISRSGWGWGE